MYDDITPNFFGHHDKKALKLLSLASWPEFDCVQT